MKQTQLKFKLCYPISYSDPLPIMPPAHPENTEHSQPSFIVILLLSTLYCFQIYNYDKDEETKQQEVVPVKRYF